MDNNSMFQMIQSQLNAKIINEMIEGLSEEQRNKIREAIVETILDELEDSDWKYKVQSVVRTAVVDLSKSILAKELEDPAVSEKIRASVETAIRDLSEGVAGKILADNMKNALRESIYKSISDLDKITPRR